MKKLLFNKRISLLFICTILILVGFQAVYGESLEPGSQQDPIISQSYLEQVIIPQLQEDMNAKIATLTQKIDKLEGTNQQSGSGDQFKVVSVKHGQKLIGGAGTELILRMGKANIIATQKGGLADATQGIDLANGVSMPANHLLIIPVDDGRGLAAQADILVMVKGTYTIQ